MLNRSDPLERARRYEQEMAAQLPAHERPLMHLTPLVGWMNDPNGFCWYQGQYHLFYQYHPYATVWGPMHWGHAVSADLTHWTYEPCALAPDTAADAGGCFSGSALPLPDGRLMLMYTGVQPAGTQHRTLQAQCVAIGDGTNFEKCPQNPVISAADLPEGYSPFDFRDPKLLKTATGYACVVGNRHDERSGSILLFESEDALTWRFVRELDCSRGEYGYMWECPDIFQLGGRQVMLVSPQEMYAREGFHAGYGTMALIGDLDEEGAFTRAAVQPVDAGLDFYAPQTTLSPDGRRIMIAWMENWETCKEAPRTHAWYGQMTFPREIGLREGRLVQQPVREIEQLWRERVTHRLTVHGECALPGVEGRTMDLEVRLHCAGSACRRFSLRVAKDATHETLIRCDLARGELTFDRSHAGSRRDIVHTRHIRIPVGETLTLRVLVDKESVELFVNDGEQALTALIATPLNADGITLAADEPILAEVEARTLAG